MTDSKTPETDAESDAGTEAETKPGPPNPQAEGVDAPTPPGGPLRQDGVGEGGVTGGVTGGHDDDASASRVNDKHAEEAGGHTIPIEDEQPGPDHDRDREEKLQEENAETSLDQPSGSGSED